MGLMGTLAKVAVGVAVAKAAGGMMKKKRSAGDAGTGRLFGEAHSPTQAGGGLEDMIGGLLGGQTSQAGEPNVLGGLLESLAGGQRGGMNGMLTQAVNKTRQLV